MSLATKDPLNIFDSLHLNELERNPICMENVSSKEKYFDRKEEVNEYKQNQQDVSIMTQQSVYNTLEKKEKEKEIILLNAIKEAREKYQEESNISSYIKILPNCYKLGIPVIIDSIRGISEQKLEEFDLMIGSLSDFWIENIKKYVSCLKIGDDSRNASCVDFSIISSVWQEVSEMNGSMKAAFLHELTHIKQFSAEYIYGDIFLNDIKKINEKAQQIAKTVLLAPLYSQRPAWKKDINERFKLSEGIGDYVVIISMILDSQDTLTANLKQEGIWVYFLEKINGERIELTEKQMKTLASKQSFIKKPYEGYIVAYAYKGNFSENNIPILSQDLDAKEIGYITNMYEEELTTIVEQFYGDRKYFEEVMLIDKNGTNIPLNKEYDETSKYPLLREKCRLMIKYGFLDEKELQKYFIL